MYDYMKALHARFCKEPELQKVRAEMERTYREIKARLGQQDQETLLQLADDAIQVLKQQGKKTGSSPWVFPSPIGGPISPDSVLHMLHRVLKRAGLPRVRFHDLRHTFATLALQNGVDVKTVSGMLEHFLSLIHISEPTRPY